MIDLGRPLRCLALAAAVAVLAAGCAGKSSRGGGDREAPEQPSRGPHGGPLVKWGRYHAEFTVDRDRQQATVYILDGTGRGPAAVAAETVLLTITNLAPPLTLELEARPQKEGPQGKSSRFVGTDEGLGTKKPFRGTISGKLVDEDEPLSGDFKEEGADKQ